MGAFLSLPPLVGDAADPGLSPEECAVLRGRSQPTATVTSETKDLQWR